MLPDVATPCLVVDEAVLRRNVQQMADRAAGLGVTLRPHAKTHKSPAIAELQLAAGAVGLTVATLSEALVFADAGVLDLFVAYPLWIDHTRARLLRRLEVLGVDLTLGCDSAESAEQIARHSSDPSRSPTPPSAGSASTFASSKPSNARTGGPSHRSSSARAWA